MSNIIAFAGAKQSGKTTSVNFLHGHEMKSHDFIKEFFIDEAGRLVVNAKYLDDNDKEFEGTSPQQRVTKLSPIEITPEDIRTLLLKSLDNSWI